MMIADHIFKLFRIPMVYREEEFLPQRKTAILFLRSRDVSSANPRIRHDLSTESIDIFNTHNNLFKLLKKTISNSPGSASPQTSLSSVCGDTDPGKRKEHDSNKSKRNGNPIVNQKI